MNLNSSRRAFLAGATRSLPVRVFGQNRNPKFPWKLGVVTGEISQDLEWALEFLRNYSLQ